MVARCANNDRHEDTELNDRRAKFVERPRIEPLSRLTGIRNDA
jgi:hypothetical protein